MSFYTSYFGSPLLKEIKDKAILVAISRKFPEHYKEGQLLIAAPEYNLFQRWRDGWVQRKDYFQEYGKHLLKNEKVLKIILRQYATHNKPVIFLCYEPDIDECHRSVFLRFVKWLKIDIKELSEEDAYEIKGQLTLKEEI